MFDLGEEIARVWAGAGDEKAMIESFRGSVLLVPHLGDGYVVAGDCGDVRWLYGFTTPAELAAWVVARGGDGDVEHGYVTVRGSRLLDVAVREVGVPAGIAIDAAGSRPMLLPPVRGIVPDDVAVDADSWNGE